MSTPSYDEIQAQVTRRYRRRSFLIYHAIIAFFGLSAVFFISPNLRVFLPLAAMWGGVLALQFVHLVLENAKDREIERTWRRYYGDLDYEKPKRQNDYGYRRTLRLSDDAELEVVDDEPEERDRMRGR